MPEKYCSESLAKELIKVLTPSDRVLLARSRNGSIKLSKELEKQDIFYKDLALYHVKGNLLQMICFFHNAPIWSLAVHLV